MMGAGTAREGRVGSIHGKPPRPGERGLPKPELETAQVDREGLVGDYNRYRHERLHDDPDSALLILPGETLAELARDGWPVRPGDLGENLTLEGLPYAALHPGVTLAVGPELVVTVRRACTPCQYLAGLPYVGPARLAEFQRAVLGRRGWYARVDRPGRIHRGDPVRVLAGP